MIMSISLLFVELKKIYLNATPRRCHDTKKVLFAARLVYSLVPQSYLIPIKYYTFTHRRRIILYTSASQRILIAKRNRKPDETV